MEAVLESVRSARSNEHPHHNIMMRVCAVSWSYRATFFGWYIFGLEGGGISDWDWSWGGLGRWGMGVLNSVGGGKWRWMRIVGHGAGYSVFGVLPVGAERSLVTMYRYRVYVGCQNSSVRKHSFVGARSRSINLYHPPPGSDDNLNHLTHLPPNHHSISRPSPSSYTLSPQP